MMRRFALACLLTLGLAACGAEQILAPEADVSRAAYTHPGPKTLTLFTVVNNRTNDGAHSGLMVNASQRVLFDPAGTWRHSGVPERNDVQFGMTPQVVNFYVDYHSRETYHVVSQEITVSPEIAEQALALVLAHGAAPKATCAMSISGILRELGFGHTISSAWFPRKVMKDFALLPDVRTEKFFDDSADDNRADLAAQQAQ